MPNDSASLRQEMIALLGRIVGDKPLPPDLQRTALELFAQLVPAGDSAATLPGAGGAAALAGPQPATGAGVTTATGTRRLIYVHGICRHVQHFSDPWWNSLHPFVPTAFGQGVLGQTRLEVIWSDIVNAASAALAAAAGGAGAARVVSAEQARKRTSDEIKEALRDRADQHMLNAALRSDGLAGGPMAAGDTSGLISIPGVNCIDDFSIYLIDDGVRQQIIDRFIAVVRPEIQAGRELDIISHSWGTVVAYEGLRQMEDEGLTASVVCDFFTVGAALSIGPVKSRLRDANKDGRKPASVRRWLNLDAHGDLVGGPLKGRPFAVDQDFVNLQPVGCSSFLGLVNPTCAHSSYFDSSNVAVNRDIFARFVN
jgi:hypothetical protein